MVWMSLSYKVQCSAGPGLDPGCWCDDPCHAMPRNAAPRQSAHWQKVVDDLIDWVFLALALHLHE